MINSKVLFAALCLSASSAMAVPFDGFYVGAGVGGSQGDFDIKQSIDISPTINGAPVLRIVGDNNGDFTDSSLLGNLNIGYGHVFKQKFFLGLEADANFQSLEGNSKRNIQELGSAFTLQANSKADLHTALSLTLDPGFVFNKTTLLYGKIGPAWGDFSTRSSVDYSQEPFTGATLAGNTSAHDSGYESGLLLGLGLEHYVSSKLSLKLEYTHINYGGISTGNSEPGAVTTSSTSITAGGSVVETSSVDAQSNQVLFGLAYHFA